jgi:hypothetical protein
VRPHKIGVARFMTVKGGATNDPTVTTWLVDDLTKQTDRVWGLECKATEVVKGNKCVAIEKPPWHGRQLAQEGGRK